MQSYLADVYVLEEHRGRGLGVELVRFSVEEGPLAGTKWYLHTRDAHDLYRKFGFTEPSERVLERKRSSSGFGVFQSAASLSGRTLARPRSGSAPAPASRGRESSPCRPRASARRS